MKVPAPLYKDPIYDGAADPMVIQKRSDGLFYMFYTQRRANQQVENVSYKCEQRICPDKRIMD